MAILNWVGSVSTDSTNVANWVDVGTGSAPTSIAATDTLEFKGAVAAGDCLIGQSSLGLLITDEEFARTYKLIFGVGTLQLMQLTLAHEQKIQFTQSSTAITFAGTHPTGAPYYNHPVIFYGDVDYVSSGYAKTTVSFILNNGNGAAAYLTDGELPNVTLNNKFTFNRSADVDGASLPAALRAYAESNCCKLTIGSTATFDNTPITYSDTQKHIRVTGDGSSSGQHFACAAAICDFSNAKLTIDAKNSQQMPCTNDTTNFGTTTDFIALLEDVVVGNFSGNANKNIIPEGLTLECASLEIQSGSYLYGGGTNLQTGAKSHIHVIEKPTIRGTWNFEETANGIYSSIGGVSSASIHTLKSDTVHILGKLTVDGLIDPTGLELTPVGSNPGGVANNTLWLDSTDSNKLKLGSSEVSGGGSGDITGVTITTDSGGGSKAEDTGGSADFSILGATGVGVTNSGATITAVAVPAEIDHDSLQNFVAAEHVDWAGASAGTIHASNYTDTNTQLSNAQVRTAVEAATDSNVFTDADHTKLNGVEASADVTDSRILQSEEWGDDNAVGWWTFAVIKGRDAVGNGQRGQAQFYIQETDSSRHRTARIEVGHHFGRAGANFITLLGASGYGNELSFTDFRIKNADTYDGAALQIYISNATNNLEAHMMMNLGASYGWTLLDTILADSNTSGHNAILGFAAGSFANFADSFSVDKTLDIEETGIVDANDGGGIATTGGLAVDGAARITGNITAGGTVDGRDLATDGSKLDGIEASADVTDATNVTAAGALMDSECTNLAAVKAFDGDATASNCLWNDISADVSASGINTNVLINNWEYTSGSTALRDAMSSGIFTCTSALAGKYIVIAKIQFKPNGLTDGTRNHKLQILAYRRDGGGDPDGQTLVNFARHMNANYFGGYILETTFTVDLANTDTFGIYGRIATSSGSGTWKIASGSNAMTSLTFIKIA